VLCVCVCVCVCVSLKSPSFLEGRIMGPQEVGEGDSMCAHGKATWKVPGLVSKVVWDK
jgi:hypothetical protein